MCPIPEAASIAVGCMPAPRPQIACAPARSSSSSGIGPADPDHRGAADIFRDRPCTIPTERAITRSLTPQAYFRRRTSRISASASLGGHSDLPLRGPQKEDLAPFRSPTTCPASPSTGWPPRPDRVPLSIGIVAAFHRKSVAACLGFRKPSLPQPAEIVFRKSPAAKQIAFSIPRPGTPTE